MKTPINEQELRIADETERTKVIVVNQRSYTVPLDVADALSEARKDSERYVKRFRHYHVNAGDGSDRCKECGFDLRDQIHLRA